MIWAVANGAASSKSRIVRVPENGTLAESVPDTVKRTLRPPCTTSAVAFGLLDVTVVVTGPFGVFDTVTGR